MVDLGQRVGNGMTDAEMHARWLAGVSVKDMAQEANVSLSTIDSRIKRRRARDGEAAWPRRPSIAAPRRAPRPMARRYAAGEPTLPPLPSLRPPLDGSHQP